MPTAVQAVLHEPGLELPLELQHWTMYEVPRVGAHYWHNRTGYRIQRIDQTEPLTVHLVRDPSWEEEIHAGLPGDYLLSGGRRSDDGTWHFSMVGPSGRLNDAWSVDDDLDAAIREVVGQAHASLARAQRPA